MESERVMWREDEKVRREEWRGRQGKGQGDRVKESEEDVRV